MSPELYYTTYGINTTYQYIGAGTTPINVSANLTGLSPNTTYNFRIIAARGTTTFNGENESFTTPGPLPICATNAATDVTYNSARLNGTVNPNGIATSAYFNYGLTTSYTVTTTSQSIGSGLSYFPVNADPESVISS